MKKIDRKKGKKPPKGNYDRPSPKLEQEAEKQKLDLSLAALFLQKTGRHCGGMFAYPVFYLRLNKDRFVPENWLFIFKLPTWDKLPTPPKLPWDFDSLFVNLPSFKIILGFSNKYAF